VWGKYLAEYMSGLVSRHRKIRLVVGKPVVGKEAGGKSAGVRSVPVRTNPLSFNAMQPFNQRVLGTAPVMRKT
jgi:hypothetical protein